MARYNKIDLGPARENAPQTEEALAAVAITPGSLVYRSSATEFSLLTAALAVQGQKFYIADANWCAGYDVDDDNTAGETMIGQNPLPRKSYAALLADGQNMTQVDTPLKQSATDGVLDIGTPGVDEIVAYGREIYNNNTGSAQLVVVRAAV